MGGSERCEAGALARRLGRRLFRVRNGGLGARPAKPEAAGAGCRGKAGGRVAVLGCASRGAQPGPGGQGLFCFAFFFFCGFPCWARPARLPPHPPPSAAAAILRTLTTAVAHFLRRFPATGPGGIWSRSRNDGCIWETERASSASSSLPNGAIARGWAWGGHLSDGWLMLLGERGVRLGVGGGRRRAVVRGQSEPGGDGRGRSQRARGCWDPGSRLALPSG